MGKMYAVFDGTTDENTQQFVEDARKDTIGDRQLNLDTQADQESYQKYLQKLNTKDSSSYSNAVRSDEQSKFTDIRGVNPDGNVNDTMKASLFTINNERSNVKFTFMGKASSYGINHETDLSGVPPSTTSSGTTDPSAVTRTVKKPETFEEQTKKANVDDLNLFDPTPTQKNKVVHII